ncbi:unnamed protein product, partial [Ilex paraguariensis]
LIDAVSRMVRLDFESYCEAVVDGSKLLFLDQSYLSKLFDDGYAKGKSLEP